MRNTLASSRKAWRIIQSLIGRVVYGGRFNELAGGDFWKVPTIASEDHPFKVTRSGNTIRFTPGLVQFPYNISSTPGYSWYVDDGGGYTYIPTADGGGPIYLMLSVSMGYSIPTQITTSIQTYPVVSAGSFVAQIFADSPRLYFSSTAIGGPYSEPAQITFVPPDGTAAECKVPICYLSDTKTVQLIDGNVSLTQLAAHRNLTLWP